MRRGFEAKRDRIADVEVAHASPACLHALSFGNHILGRIYFMGRFGEKVRDEQGLAYYAYSELQGGYGRGAWQVRAGVNPNNLDKALGSIDTELRRFLADGPTPEEQSDGVSSLLGSLPRQLETNEGAAAVMGEIEYFAGLPELGIVPHAPHAGPLLQHLYELEHGRGGFAGRVSHTYHLYPPANWIAADILRIEESLSDHLTAQVEIRIKKRTRHGEQGEVSIGFGSLEELNGLLDKLGLGKD